MIAFSQGNVSQIRTIALAAILIATAFFLVRSFQIKPGHASAATHSVHGISSYVPSRWSQSTTSSRITKVTSNLGDNDLIESALGTHKPQNNIHGYDVRVLHERIVDGWSSQATYLLSIIVSELEKPEKERTEWLFCFQPDLVVLNPQIPLEIFLPPGPEFDHVHVLATHTDHGELDSGVFFLRVHEWSAKMLSEIISVSSDTSELEHLKQPKDHSALKNVLKGADFRDSVYYQPREWYNAYALSANSWEYQRGDMHLHFQGVGGDKWSGLSNTLDLLSSKPSDFSIPLGKTTYKADTTAYWKRIKMAFQVLKKAEQRLGEEDIEEKVQRLSYATNYEADNEKVMKEAIDELRDAMGVSHGEHAI